MLRLVLSSYIFFHIAIAMGQPIITTEVLPKIGDTIIMASDNLPENIDALNRGDKQEWDFMGLQSAYGQKVAVKAIDKNHPTSLFSEANLMIEGTNDTEYFFKRPDKHSLDLIGIKGLDPLNLGISTTVYFAPPLQYFHFPLKYGDKTQKEGSFYFKVAVQDLPKEMIYSLPITPDSVRFRCKLTQQKEIDAWGTLALPDNTYEVLREKHIETRNYEVAVKNQKTSWENITADISKSLLPKKQVLTAYNFYSNEIRTKVATVNMNPDNNQPKSVQYIVSEASSNLRLPSGKADIYAYPNPAINEVRFELSNLKPSTYILKIYNILGVVVQEESYKLNGFKTVKLDISKLRKGTYLYSLADAKGKTVATRRLIVIRP